VCTSTMVAAEPVSRIRLAAQGQSHACIRIRSPGLGRLGPGAGDRFDPYVASDHTIDTDLELTAASGIVEQQGGSLRLRSAGSGAAEIELLLPLSEA
jgi:hypothetical protein